MGENIFEQKQKEDNLRAVEAKTDPAKRDAFLSEERYHILRLAAVILKRSITMSDDEYSIALIATSEAIDGYDPEKNDFWVYAAFVIRNRLADLYRRESRYTETAVSPEAFEGNTDEEDPVIGVSLEVREQIAIKSLGVNTSLRDEIVGLNEELAAFGIDFTDLTECSPKTAKTRSGCADIIRAIFMTPSLAGVIKQTGKLPTSDILKRGKLQKKLLERHRKYLIAATVILDGDYPRLSEYVDYLKPKDTNIISFEERRSGS